MSRLIALVGLGLGLAQDSVVQELNPPTPGEVSRADDDAILRRISPRQIQEGIARLEEEFGGSTRGVRQLDDTALAVASILLDEGSEAHEELVEYIATIVESSGGRGVEDLLGVLGEGRSVEDFEPILRRIDRADIERVARYAGFSPRQIQEGIARLEEKYGSSARGLFAEEDTALAVAEILLDDGSEAHEELVEFLQESLASGGGGRGVEDFERTIKDARRNMGDPYDRATGCPGACALPLDLCAKECADYCKTCEDNGDRCDAKHTGPMHHLALLAGAPDDGSMVYAECVDPCYAADSTVFVQGESGVEARALASVIPGKTRLLSRGVDGRLYFDELEYIRHNGKYSTAPPLYSKDLLEIVLDVDGDRGTLRLTPDHFVRLSDGSMISAGDLKSGHELLTASGVGRFVRAEKYLAETQVLTPVTGHDEFLIAAPGVSNYTLAAVGTFQTLDTDRWPETRMLVFFQRFFGTSFMGSSRRAFCADSKKAYDDCWALDEFLAESLYGSWREYTDKTPIFIKGPLIILAAVILLAVNWAVIYLKETMTLVTLIAAFRLFSKHTAKQVSLKL